MDCEYSMNYEVDGGGEWKRNVYRLCDRACSLRIGLVRGLAGGFFGGLACLIGGVAVSSSPRTTPYVPEGSTVGCQCRRDQSLDDG
jgi:hypothetical protein